MCIKNEINFVRFLRAEPVAVMQVKGSYFDVQNQMIWL